MAGFTKLLASLGRYGDSKIRNVDGMPAHVTSREANLLDTLGSSIEPSIKKHGAGTINPNTGLKEYHIKKIYSGGPAKPFNSHNQKHWGTRSGDPHPPKAAPVGDPTSLSYEQLTELSEDQMGGYLKTFGLEEEDTEFFTDIFQEKPFEFMEAEAGLAREQLSGQAQKGVRDIYSQADKLSAKAGFATSGGVTQMMQQSMDQLLGGYDLESKEIRLGLDRSRYDEQQRQRDEFYDMITQVESFS